MREIFRSFSIRTLLACSNVEKSREGVFSFLGGAFFFSSYAFGRCIVYEYVCFMEPFS